MISAGRKGEQTKPETQGLPAGISDNNTPFGKMLALVICKQTTRMVMGLEI